MCSLAARSDVTCKRTELPLAWRSSHPRRRPPRFRSGRNRSVRASVAPALSLSRGIAQEFTTLRGADAPDEKGACRVGPRRTAAKPAAFRPEGKQPALSIRASSGCTDRTHRGRECCRGRPYRAGLPQTWRGERGRPFGVVPQLVPSGSQSEVGGTSASTGRACASSGAASDSDGRTRSRFCFERKRHSLGSAAAVIPAAVVTSL